MKQGNTQLVEDFINLGFRSINNLFDYWSTSLSNVTWAQEQIEKIINTAMDQGKVSREEGIKIIEEFMTKTKDNQIKMQEMVIETVKSTIVALQLPVGKD